MKLWKVLFSKQTLTSIPDSERVFLIQLGHLSNELSTLQKLLYFSAPAQTFDRNAIDRIARNSQALFITRLTAGKLWEAWELIRTSYFQPTLSRIYDSVLDEKGQNGLRNLKKYFSGESLIYKVRNQFAFHYSSQGISDQIEELSQSEQLEVYLSENVGNSFHSMSDVIVNSAMLSTVTPGNIGQSLETFFGDVLNVIGWFLDFIGAVMVAIIDRHIGPNLSTEEIEIPDPPAMDDVDLPYFVVRPRDQ